jgi:hypothetical protein
LLVTALFIILKKPVPHEISPVVPLKGVAVVFEAEALDATEVPTELVALTVKV